VAYWKVYLILIWIDYRWPIARTILLAGHETSATTLCWIILELARHPHVQTRLRKEIRETEAAIHARGGSDFTASDLDGMSYLNAVLKVSYLQSNFLPRPSGSFLRLCFLLWLTHDFICCYCDNRSRWGSILLCIIISDKQSKMTYYRCLGRSLRQLARFCPSFPSLKDWKSYFPSPGTIGP